MHGSQLHIPFQIINASNYSDLLFFYLLNDIGYEFRYVDRAPISPLPCRRTDAFPSFISFSPITSIYGTGTVGIADLLADLLVPVVDLCTNIYFSAFAKYYVHNP